MNTVSRWLSMLRRIPLSRSNKVLWEVVSSSCWRVCKRSRFVDRSNFQRMVQNQGSPQQPQIFSSFAFCYQYLEELWSTRESRLSVFYMIYCAHHHLDGVLFIYFVYGTCAYDILISSFQLIYWLSHAVWQSVDPEQSIAVFFFLRPGRLAMMS